MTCDGPTVCMKIIPQPRLVFSSRVWKDGNASQGRPREVLRKDVSHPSIKIFRQSW